MRLRVRPMQPMIKTSLGFSTRSMEMKRSMDCRLMLRPRARRNAPLKNAPRSWARAQPKERS
jgi:hypothetical protein